MAHYPSENSEKKLNPIALFWLWELMATPEEKARRIEQDKVYELKKMNRNIEEQRFIQPTVRRWKPDMTLVYLAVLESVLVLAAVAFIALYLYLNGGQC